MLSDDEATAVAFGLVVAERRGIAAGDALAKIMRVLPGAARAADRAPARRGDAASASRALRPRPRARRCSSSPRPCGGGARWRSTTRAATARASTRVIEPLGLVARRGRWYVPAHDRASGELRTFRADRIGRAAIGEPGRAARAGLRPGRARRPDARATAVRVAGRGARRRADRRGAAPRLADARAS